jgi:hypothetical protein
MDKSVLNQMKLYKITYADLADVINCHRNSVAMAFTNPERVSDQMLILVQQAAKACISAAKKAEADKKANAVRTFHEIIMGKRAVADVN